MCRKYAIYKLRDVYCNTKDNTSDDVFVVHLILRGIFTRKQVLCL